ncbi:hypothetical protein RvY_03946 [Ramazzottius varieornatus]|uniref:ShKT domain-containing protein n=1 Tax=Ramazzottius varieornatus TaxID=947166 RepID=A0A1D1UTB0_RAMVA|nr:hypothetical protein RvY_03946 [Ramazzottius varieornatus]
MVYSICRAFLAVAACMVFFAFSAFGQTNTTSQAATTVPIVMLNTTFAGSKSKSTAVPTIPKELIVSMPQAREDDSKASRPIDVDFSSAINDDLVALDQLSNEDPSDIPPPRQDDHISCRRFCRRFCRDSDDSLSCQDRCKPTCRLARL